MQHVRLFCAVLMSSVLVLGCGPKPDGGGGGGGGGVVKVTPGDIEAEAKAPNQALILGTDTSGGSTIIALAEGESSVSVDSMWVKMGPPASGGSSPVKLTTAPNPEGTVRVGMYEEFSGGLGPQWRAGVWLSAFLSSTTLGKDLTDFKFTAEAGGNVDGASASGLMTAGYLAALTGTAIDAEATMTGIINPDGTIGPVGGIPQKFAGSIALGKKRLGYPIGMRYSVDVNTGEAVDLQKLAKDAGATAVEISDIYGAYELMTGQKLPKPVAVDEKDMELEDEVIAAFEAKYTEWQAMVSKEWDRILELDSAGQLPQGLIQLALIARGEVEIAEKLKKQGMANAAYKHMVDAWVYAASATTTSDILQSVQANDLVGAKATLHQIEGLSALPEMMVKEVGTMKPDTMGGHLLMLSAYEKAIAGLAGYMYSSTSVDTTRMFLDNLSTMTPEQLAEFDIAEETVRYTAPTVLAIARAVAHATGAKESMDIEGVKSLNYMCSLPNVRRLATSFQSAASANVTYFETLVGVKDDMTRNYVMAMEPDYLTAYISANLPKLTGMPETLKTEWGEDSLPWGLMTLASAQLAYFKASTLISKWYSLGVQNDWLTGRATSVEHEKAFMNMLTTAERKARENARAASVAAGSIPVQARIAYQNARILREGDLADKLQALEAYWASSAYSQTAVMLARN
jgi:uncharacterized protein